MTRTVAAIASAATLLSAGVPALAAPDERGPSLDATLAITAGHDDQVLADPEGLGFVEPLSERLGSASCRLGIDWRREAGRFRLESSVAWTTYGGDGPESDTDLRFAARWQRSLGEATALESSAEAVRFRRDGVPLFDLDRFGAEVRVVHTVSPDWTAGIGAALRRPTFPGRIVTGSTTRTQRDIQGDLTASILRSFGEEAWAGLEAGFRSTASNDDIYAYAGPTLVAHLAAPLLGALRASAWSALHVRKYSDYPLLTPGGAPTGEQRSDRTWQAGLGLEQPLGRAVSAFVDAAWIRQTSNVDGVEYDQALYAAGLRWTLRPRESGDPIGSFPWRGVAADASAPWASPGSEPDAGSSADLVPSPASGGILFRIAAPGAAAVSVVGGFNAWDTGRHPMSPVGKGGNSGIWEVVVPIAPGRWRFAFIVDGEWTEPPAAVLFEEDGFGGRVGILTAGAEP